jgi:hypothetical protein
VVVVKSSFDSSELDPDFLAVEKNGVEDDSCNCSK